MSLPVVLSLAAAAVVTVVALVVIVVSVVRSMRELGRDLLVIRERVLPDLERLQRDAEVTAAELDRVSTSIEQIGHAGRAGHRDGV